MFKIIKKYKELYYLAYHDSLTGLLNRNWLYKNIDTIKAEYVYFIDINDLHKMNEKGHTFGDEHIKMVVAVLKSCNGILVRYAGDEFILFSNYKDLIKTNKLFAVGFSSIYNSIKQSIQMADLDMVQNKKSFKNDR